MSGSVGSLGSASSSLPVNLGVGANQAQEKEAVFKLVNLDMQQRAQLENNLNVVRKLYSQKGDKPTSNELKMLSGYINHLVEDSSQHFVVEALQSMIKRDGATQDEFAVSEFAEFVAKLRKDHVEIAVVDYKFKHLDNPMKLTCLECYLIDKLSNIVGFANKVFKAGLETNKHINHVKDIHATAEENAFREFQDGDVLFYELPSRMAYYDSSSGFFGNVMMTALGTSYCHVGVFYRNQQGKPCVAQIQGGYSRQRLTFGEQCFIKGKRIDPAKFMNTELTEKERLAAQKYVAGVYTNVVAGENYDIGITMGQQLGCIWSHTTSEPKTLLGRVKIEKPTKDEAGNKQDVNYLCSEFAARALMEAFHKVNEANVTVGLNNKKVKLVPPFDAFEDLASMHPERLLVATGPYKKGGTDENPLPGTRIDSGWDDVSPLPAQTGFLPIDKMLPDVPRFPESSYPNKKEDAAITDTATAPPAQVVKAVGSVPQRNRDRVITPPVAPPAQVTKATASVPPPDEDIEGSGTVTS